MTCFLHGFPASCRDRVKWAAGHLLHRAPDACPRAHGQVLRECEVCASCELLEVCGLQRGLALPLRAAAAATTIDAGRAAPAPTTAAPITTSTTATRTTPVSHDCAAEPAAASSGWPSAQREWCCLHHNVGCPSEFISTSTTTVSQPLGTATTSGSQTSTSASTTTTLSSTTTTSQTATSTSTSTTTTFDCSIQGLRSTGPLSDGRREHCCLHFARACPGQPLESGEIPHSFDCSMSSGGTRSRWSAEQTRWCCKWQKKGCPGASEGEASGLVDTDAGGGGGGGSGGKAPPPSPTSSGEAPSTTSERFDCHHGLSNWQMAWSFAKAEWCCRQHSLGCPSASAAATVGKATSAVVSLKKAKFFQRHFEKVRVPGAAVTLTSSPSASIAKAVYVGIAFTCITTFAALMVLIRRWGLLGISSGHLYTPLSEKDEDQGEAQARSRREPGPGPAE